MRKPKKKPAFTFSFKLNIPIEDIVKWDAAKTAAFFNGLADLMHIKDQLPPPARRASKGSK